MDATAMRALVSQLAEDDPFCAAPPPEACEWSEERIRAFFDSGGTDHGTPAQSFGAPDPEEFGRWFPGLDRSKTRCASPRMRLLCFTNAGNEENIYTNEGLGTRRVAVLLEWCRANSVELLAPQLPGRGQRMKEAFMPDVQTVAATLVALLATRLRDTPYCVIGHSLGTWVAYETLALAQERGLPMPKKAFLSCFPAPDLPLSERPWRQQRSLLDDAFREECRGWDVSDALLQDARMWAQYVALMRADFKLFDEYECCRLARFDFPILAFHAVKDRRVTPQHVQRWAAFTSGAFATREVSGHHLFVMGMGEQRSAKEAWLSGIVAELAEVL